MASDRFVHFMKRVPTDDEIARILDNYFNAAATIVKDGNRWTISIAGKPTPTFRGIDGAQPRPTEEVYDERWLEVFLHRKDADAPAAIDVITRCQDEFTNGIADRLAKAIARFYRGRLEDD